MGIKRGHFIEKVKAKLASAFSMVDIGPISFYFGFNVKRDREKKTIKLSQIVHIGKVFKKFYLSNANGINTPMKKTALYTSRTVGEASNSKEKNIKE